jgi:Ca-activated chloride channel family protein
MKATNVALLALAGMLLTSISVYSLTPPGGIALASSDPSVTPESVTPPGTSGSRPDDAPLDTAKQEDLSRFTAGSTLMVDGRVAHAKLAKGAPGETFVLLEVRGSDAAATKSSAPVNLAIVIDRSGSMKGSRMRNAQNAATAAVDRLNDGDVVSVITFDTQTAVTVPPTSIGPGARERVNSAIRGIALGGDTCVSCGVEAGLAELDRTSGRINRMIVLSDGDANHGVRDVPGFRSIAERARSRGSSITTIGVDVDYNEKILAALAQESNGRHYFVENDDKLARIFEAEAESLTSSIASGAEAAIELAPGVELDRVLDRSFRRAGSRVIVPLGTFDRGEVKTVLMKVRVPTFGGGPQPVAGVDLTYKDLVLDKDGGCTGKLGVEVTSDASAASSIDPVVEGRLSRSETAATLREANSLFERGRVDDARRKLDAQAEGLRAKARKVAASAPAGAAGVVDKDFERQLRALDEATSGFATPPPAQAAPGAAPAPPPQESRQGKGAVRKNQETVLEMGF